MSSLHSAAVDDVLRLAHKDLSPLLAEMTEYGEEESFPTVGPVAGRALRLLAGFVDADRIFEFGSGFGYSAAWFIGALPDAGEIVLTDYDTANLEQAEAFLSRSPHNPTIHYESGNALEIFQQYSGPFDVVLIDHDKDDYRKAVEMVEDHVPPGGVIIADNMLGGPVTPETVRTALQGDAPDEAAAGVAEYISYIRDETDAASLLVPLGEGLLVSRL